MDDAVHDFRVAVRALRRAPALAAAAAVVLALSAAVVAPALTLARSALAGSALYTDQAGPVLGGAGDGVALLRAERPDAGLADPALNRPTGRTPVARAPGIILPPTETAESVAQVQTGALRTLLWVLLALAALVLVVGMINVAALLLARGSARRGETVMRAVLGAPRARVLRLLLAEGAVVALAGAGAGTLAAAAGLHLLRATWPLGTPPWSPLSPDALAAGAVLGALAMTALVAALAPARAAGRRDLYPALNVAARATPGPPEGWQRRLLVTLQVGATTTLLTCGALLLRGFDTAGSVAGLGFDPRDTLTVQVDLGAARYADPRVRLSFQRRVLAGVEELPGMRAVSLASTGAWMGLGTEDWVLAQGMAPFPLPPAVVRRARHHAVSPGYFAATGVPLTRGRDFGAGDAAGTRPVAVVTESFAGTMLPGVDPIGKPIRIGGEQGTWYTVVGVVGEVRARGVGSGGDITPAVYLSTLQHPPRSFGVAVRTAGDPMAAWAAVRDVLRVAGPGAAAYAPMTMGERLERFAAPLRWFAGVFAVLAGVATLLAAVALHGVVSHTVARLTREIGVRMAVGAQAREVVRMVTGDTLRLTLRGAVLGLWGGVSLARLLQFFFLGVDPFDPVVYAGITVVLGGTALAASWVPARRAAGVDPMVALRAE